MLRSFDSKTNVLPVSSLKVDHEKDIGIFKLPYGELDKRSVFVWLIITALDLLVLDLGSLATVMKRRGLLTGAFCHQLHFYNLLGQPVGHLTPILTLKFPQPCPNRKVLWGGPTSENDREKLKEQDRMETEILEAKLLNDRVCMGNSSKHLRTIYGAATMVEGTGRDFVLAE
jgi:hypothetical protein